MSVSLLPLTDRASAVPFAGMTYPHFVPALLGGSAVAVGATDPEPCGLVLAELQGDHAVVRSVLVKATHRGRGIGTRLMRAAEDALRARGATGLSGTYPAGKETTPALERVLAKCGWDAPEPSMYLFTLPPETAATAPRTALWLQPREWPAGFELVRWPDIPPEAFDEVAGRVESGEVPAIVSPFLDPDAIVPHFSIALLGGGRMAAWAAIHRVGTTYRCTALYADPKTVPPGVGMQLLGRTYWQWLELVDGGDTSPVSFGIHAANPFLRVFQRRVLPSMVGHTVTVTMSCGKSF